MAANSFLKSSYCFAMARAFHDRGPTPETRRGNAQFSCDAAAAPPTCLRFIALRRLIVRRLLRPLLRLSDDPQIRLQRLPAGGKFRLRRLIVERGRDDDVVAG